MSEIIITDQNVEHKYFCLLQNLLSRIGLTAFERSAYWAIKECCGEKGSCTKSYKNLAIASGMSEPSLKRTIKSLAEPNKILKKPLILIKHRFTEFGDKDTNEIILVDLWDDNYKICKEKNGGITQNPPPITQNPRKITQNPGVGSHRPEGGVTQIYKEEPFNKNPMNKTTTTKPPPKASACGLVSSGGGGVSKDKLLGLIKMSKDLKFPFEELLLKELYEKFPQATCNILDNFNKRDETDRKVSGGWLRKQVSAEHELLELKKDYET